MSTVPRLALVLLAAMVAACGSFDDPAIIVDMRVIGAIAEPPEVLVPANPQEIDPANLPEIEVCVLVADPADSRELSYAMVACPSNQRGRCDEGARPQVDLGSGTVGDPEESGAPLRICETLRASPALADVIERSVSLDSLAGFGAIDIQVGITVWPAGNNLADAIFGTKQVRFGALLPAEREPNENPSLASVQVSRDSAGGRGLDFELETGRCADFDAPIVAPGEELGLLPIEPEGVRQDYVVPTFEGDSRSFTENISYQYLATYGKWSRANTGGPRDFAGNLPTLDTRWTAPTDLDEIGEGLDVSLFIIQRDERGGQSWTQSCVRVLP